MCMRARTGKPRRPAKRATARARPVRAAAATRAGDDELDQVFAVVAQHFALLAEPTRLKILHSICRDERSVSAIVAATGATQTNVSRHLALMHRAGVVTRRREGSAVYYRVDDPAFVEICRNVCVQIASGIDEREPLKRGLLDFAHDH
jgi:DNA-binding transcriptional ArsR family regulator